MKSVYCIFVFILFCFSFVNVSLCYSSIYYACEIGPGHRFDPRNSCEGNDRDKQLMDSLFKAAEFDDLETVKKILESNADFILGVRNGLHLLQIAAIGESLNVIEYLVREKHVGINKLPIDRIRLSPLGEAAEAGKFKAVKLLVELGADKNTISYLDDYTLLHAAAVGGNIEVCKFSLQTFHVDVRNSFGQTPAYIAASNGNLVALRFLLENGADPYARDSHNTTLMHAAVHSRQVDVVRELTRYNELINTPGVDRLKNVLLPIDVISDMEVVKVLVDAGSNITDRCILRYIDVGNIDIVKYLLEKSGKVNMQTIWYGYPICNKTLLTTLLEKKMNYDMIEFALKQGADVNKKGCKNRTALHIVLMGYYMEEDTLAIVKLLLDRGADAVINLRDAHGFNALDYANQRSFHKVDKYLRKFGATTYPSQHGWIL